MGSAATIEGYALSTTTTPRTSILGDPPRASSASALRGRAASASAPDLRFRANAAARAALWVIATNPIVSFPNYQVLKQGLESLDFLVVQDSFHPTPTSELADLVLPAATWGEKEGTYTNSERRVSKVNRAVDPPGEAKADFDIFVDIAAHLGCKDEIYPGWTKPEDAFNEWRKVSQGRLCDYSGITYDLLDEHLGIQWPFTEGAGVGIAAIGAGVGIGFAAKSKYDGAAAMCNAERCNQEGFDERESARKLGNVGTGVFAAGGALVVAGIVLVITSVLTDDDGSDAASAPGLRVATLPHWRGKAIDGWSTMAEVSW
jgi:hypothetical protein